MMDDCSTNLILRSYANTDFVRWVDYAYAFILSLETAPLSYEEELVVRRVLAMRAAPSIDMEKNRKGL